MLRFLILEIVLPLLIFSFIRSILKTLFSSNSTRVQQQAPRAQPTVVAGGELKRDPVCGTYVSTSLSVTRKVNGELVHFCSAECRDKYKAA